MKFHRLHLLDGILTNMDVMHHSTIRTVIYHPTLIHLAIPLMIQQDTPQILPGHLLKILI